MLRELMSGSPRIQPQTNKLWDNFATGKDSMKGDQSQANLM